MKAARVVARRKIEFLDVPKPGPLENGEVQVQLESLSICGSDIYLEYDADLPEEDYPFAAGAPMHECAGVVVDSRDPNYKEGQRVIVIPRDVAGMQEQVVQTADKLIKLPEWGDLSEWVMCQHSGTALFSARRWGNPMGKKIAVIGQGGIGLTFTMIAERQGAQQIVGIDLEEYRCRKSSELGATHTINASNENTVEASTEITGGDMYDVVVDASGNPEGLGIAIDLVKNEGQIISFSLVDPTTVSFDHRKWMGKNIQMNATVIAATHEPIQEIMDIVALKERGWIDPGVLKTHDTTFDKAQDAFEMYRLRQDGVIKVAMSI
ncbi:MAG: zinc-binding dehydrogenase [Chloroflexi bacterium]|nr:zinc-binding dehydrogenase [Chloroflexota bacterium]MBT5253062.1 zinc-binding dehydrogenase [Chloroflexota bacterium]MBT5475306.1 zinc-binding dehydrogenase [Chloroflexota bacterium]MBT7003196.1 zinc-binding dehydrogenase [Chloroflexota bacterium]MBT7468582.1 zinc-binding dehydrogenase [Chloroflexota bacterium]